MNHTNYTDEIYYWLIKTMAGFLPIEVNGINNLCAPINLESAKMGHYWSYHRVQVKELIQRIAIFQWS